VDGVELVAAAGFAAVQVTYPDTKEATEFLASIDPTSYSQVLEPKMAQGELTDLTDGGIIVDRQRAEDHQLGVGDEVRLTAANGEEVTLGVQAISDDLALLGSLSVSRGTAATLLPELVDGQIFGLVSDGADLDRVLADVDKAVSDTPGLQVLDREGFVGSITAQITSFVNIIYGLLVLSIIIALIGIANTLSLSINERTRELGLMRAVGMDRGQMRSTIRWEAALISALGAVVGLGLGLLFSWALLKALQEQGLTQFTVPLPSLLVIVLLAAALGTLSSIRPSRRAARLEILAAIAEE